MQYTIEHTKIKKSKSIGKIDIFTGVLNTIL